MKKEFSAGLGTHISRGLAHKPGSPADSIFNDVKPSGSPGALFAFRNEAKEDEPLEVLVYECIGKSDWTGDGMDAKAFLEKLDGVKRDRALNLRINSRGGDVFEGLAIVNRINEWRGNVVATVDGVAASIASVIAMAADEVRMPKASQMFIHDAWGMAIGNAADMRETADRLDATSDLLAGIYAEKTKQPAEEMRRMMRDSKLMNGEEAKALGFCDTVTDAAPIYNFSPEDIDRIMAMCRVGSQNNGGKPPQPKEPQMDRVKIIALLKQHGAAVDEKATDDQLLAQLNAMLEKKPQAQGDLNIIDLENRLKAQEQRAEAEKRTRITAEIDSLIAGNQLGGAMREKAIARAMADESILAEYRALPVALPGVTPVTPKIDGNASINDIEGALNAFNAPSDSMLRGNAVDPRTIAQNSVAKAQFYQKHRDRIMAAAGDNTIAAGLKRQVILQEGVRAFAAKILALRAFSTVFENVPLLGTDIVNVPFYDLETAASTDWVAATGYVAGETTTDTRAVTVNKRKYQSMGITSAEFRRQPFLDTMRLMSLKAEKLGVDVFADVLSLVTLANYGAAAITKAAVLFDDNDVADLRTACNTANWPEVGRSLIVNADYDGALVKCDSVKAALNFGANVAQTGKIPQISGFDYYWANNIPANAQNLVGMAAFVSAILVATSPIQPHPDVLSDMAAYEVVTDPTTGAAFEYRRIGNGQKDSAIEVVECNYGYIKGNASAIKRIVSA